jgi:hypothetical protein
MAKIIEAKAVISGKETLSPLVDALSKKLDQLSKNKAMATQVDNVAKSLKGVQSQLAAIDKFQASKTGFRGAADNFAKTQAAVQAAAQAMKAGEGPAKRLAADYQRAQTAASNAARAFEAQRNAFGSARRALEQMGIPAAKAAAAQDRLRASIERTNAALAKQNNPSRARQIAGGVAGTAATVGGLAAAAGAKGFATRAVTSAAELDLAAGTQRFVTGVDKAGQVPLIKQAQKIGQETPFSTTDIVKAQTKVMGSLPSDFDTKLRTEVGMGIIEPVKNYAMIMKADMETAAGAIRSFLMNTNKDISTKGKAISEATRATNLSVKMAKMGNMGDEDVQQYLKFGAAAATATGLSDTTLAAIGTTGARSGLRGDELGVFIRQASSKLVSPTAKGLDALTVAGIDYNKFVKMPGMGLNAKGLEDFSKRRLGKGLNDDQRSRINALLADGDIVSDREKLVSSIAPIIAEGFGKKKNGETKAQDASKIAKMVGDYAKLSVENVDTEGLFRAIMTNPKMTMALLNAFFTSQHGGKASVLANNFGQLIKDKAELDRVAEDPEFAARGVKEIMGGLGGSLENFKGSIEVLTQNVGTANAGLLKFAMDLGGKGLDALSNMDPNALQAASLGVGAAAMVGGGAALVKLFNGFGLSASAVALDGAAAALLTSAAALRGGAAAGIATNAAGGAIGAGTAGATAGVAATWGSRLMGAVPFLAPLAAAAGVGAGLYYLHQDASQFPGMTSGERGRKARGGSVDDARRRAWNEDRERMGLPPLGAMSAPAWPAMVGMGSAAIGGKTELTGSAEVRGEATLKVEVGASSTLLQIIEQAKSVPLTLNGQLNANGPGSVGKSSPDASAPAQIGPR